MLGIRCPDRHALLCFTSSKRADRDARSPPARAGSFSGASCPFPRFPANVPSPNDQQMLSVAAQTAIACDRPARNCGSVLAGDTIVGDREAQLANERLEAGDVRRLYPRAELIRGLLAGSRVTQEPDPGRPTRARPWGCRRRLGAAG